MTGLPVTPPYASFVVGCGLKRSTLATPHVFGGEPQMPTLSRTRNGSCMNMAVV
uniref:Uncharacterized protein n=1 Tax=Anguilla anguilla TaxID=7936 RepID=A0A0E9PRA3_ANGAN